MSTTPVLDAPKPRTAKKSFSIEEFVSSNMADMSEEQLDAVAITREELLANARAKANKHA
jgi:hypothetical protein